MHPPPGSPKSQFPSLSEKRRVLGPGLFSAKRRTKANPTFWPGQFPPFFIVLRGARSDVALFFISLISIYVQNININMIQAGGEPLGPCGRLDIHPATHIQGSLIVRFEGKRRVMRT
jgi:hypothetical protein